MKTLAPIFVLLSLSLTVSAQEIRVSNKIKSMEAGIHTRVAVIYDGRKTTELKRTLKLPVKGGIFTSLESVQAMAEKFDQSPFSAQLAQEFGGKDNFGAYVDYEDTIVSATATVLLHAPSINVWPGEYEFPAWTTQPDNTLPISRSRVDTDGSSCIFAIKNRVFEAKSSNFRDCVKIGFDYFARIKHAGGKVYLDTFEVLFVKKTSAKNETPEFMLTRLVVTIPMLSDALLLDSYAKSFLAEDTESRP